jgi:hypothetical protein
MVRCGQRCITADSGGRRRPVVQLGRNIIGRIVPVLGRRGVRQAGQRWCRSKLRVRHRPLQRVICQTLLLRVRAVGLNERLRAGRNKPKMRREARRQDQAYPQERDQSSIGAVCDLGPGLLGCRHDKKLQRLSIIGLALEPNNLLLVGRRTKQGVRQESISKEIDRRERFCSIFRTQTCVPAIQSCRPC